METQLGGTAQKRKTTSDDVGDTGEWTHGWQYWASSISDTFFRRAPLSDTHSGRNARIHHRSNACSVSWCWHACICPIPSLRRFVKGAERLWTFTATTERRA